ncbi:MAG: dTDP-4-dehydrorhamnose 3,5-epimerase [Rubricoccaceae bacterium]
MTVRPTALPDVLRIERRVYGDSRGWFVEAWSAERYRDAGISAPFVQDNVSYSPHGVLRGLHLQREPHAQGKLVSVVRGEVFDVAVDIRPASPTVGQWVGETLSAENGRQLYIPPGFAHGFVVTGDDALVTYKVTTPYAPQAEACIRWDDPEIGIEWPIDHPTLAERDATAGSLSDLLASSS